MILSDSRILKALDDGDLVIDPFDRESLGSNSYDVHLSEHLAKYKARWPVVLDAREENVIERFRIPEAGFLLLPDEFYLGSTIEYTEAHRHVPFLEGKSSTGRLGISIHETAGKGDVGFCNHWTMEISVRAPVRVYAGMPIGQLIFHEVLGKVLTPYHVKKSAKYNGRDPLPQPSRMFRNFKKAAP